MVFIPFLFTSLIEGIVETLDDTIPASDSVPDDTIPATDSIPDDTISASDSIPDDTIPANEKEQENDGTTDDVEHEIMDISSIPETEKSDSENTGESPVNSVEPQEKTTERKKDSGSELENESYSYDMNAEVEMVLIENGWESSDENKKIAMKKVKLKMSVKKSLEKKKNQLENPSLEIEDESYDMKTEVEMVLVENGWESTEENKKKAVTKVNDT